MFRHVFLFPPILASYHQRTGITATGPPVIVAASIVTNIYALPSVRCVGLTVHRSLSNLRHIMNDIRMSFFSPLVFLFSHGTRLTDPI